MYDPYSRDTPGLADPANTIYRITPSDDDEIAVGIKALRIWNSNSSTATVTIRTIMGHDITLKIPALAIWVEPIRITHVLATGTSSNMEFHGYTDSDYGL